MRNRDVYSALAASHHSRLNEAEKLKNSVKQLEHNTLGAGEESREETITIQVILGLLMGLGKGAATSPTVLDGDVCFEKDLIKKKETTITQSINATKSLQELADWAMLFSAHDFWGRAK